MQEYMLEMKGIIKTFPGVTAVDNVDLEVKPGEILALVGENGAGKSTLMKVLSGINTPDNGTVIINGEKVHQYDARIALGYGVSMIYQELSYIDSVSIAENIYLGNLPLKGRLKIVDYKKLHSDTAKLLKKVNINRKPIELLSDITIAERQLVEIARAVSRDSKVFVFDEPTSALTEKEATSLLGLIKGLASENRSIIYITHKLEEVFNVSDRIMVMRDGKRVADLKTSETNVDEVIKYMVGREIKDIYPIENKNIGDLMFNVEHLKGKRVNDVSFNVRKGEILGIFGLMGCGRTGIMETIYGARPKFSGKIKIDNKEININSPQDAVSCGIYYLPPERKTEGIISNMSVKENITISSLISFTKGFKMNLQKETFLVKEWINKLNIKTSSLEKEISALSGGNQQKTLIAKSLMTNPKLLIINEPTRGVDVGSKVEIYKILEKMCENGMSIIAICSEMPEIIAISDRIICVYDGKITGELSKDQFGQDALMRLAIGG